MKKIFKICLFALLIGLLASCQNPSNNSNETVFFSNGWWNFSTENSSIYLNYQNRNTIIRAGTFDQEYADSIVANMNEGETFKWDMCLKNATDSRMKFEKVKYENLPEWAKKITEANIFELYGEYKFDQKINCELTKYFYKDGEAIIERLVLGKKENSNTNSSIRANSFGRTIGWKILDNGDFYVSYDKKHETTKFSFDGEKIIFDEFMGYKNVSAKKIK